MRGSQCCKCLMYGLLEKIYITFRVKKKRSVYYYYLYKYNFFTFHLSWACTSLCTQLHIEYLKKTGHSTWIFFCLYCYTIAQSNVITIHIYNQGLYSLLHCLIQSQISWAFTGCHEGAEHAKRARLRTAPYAVGQTGMSIPSLSGETKISLIELLSRPFFFILPARWLNLTHLTRLSHHLYQLHYTEEPEENISCKLVFIMWDNELN